MLIGSNSIEFNEATMVLMVQYYLDNKLLNKDEKSPKVISVSAERGVGLSSTFQVRLEMPIE